MRTSHDKAVFVITRPFKATRSIVWKAWSEAEQLKNWWGPRGCTVDISRLEFRPGGFFHYAMQFESAHTMWGRFNYREILEPERIVWLNSFANEHCGIARAPFSDACPLEVTNILTLAENRGITTVTLQAEPFGEVAKERQFFEELRATGSLEQGYGATFEQLAAHLAKS